MVQKKKKMIKFLLVFQMCYSISGLCFPPMEEQVHDTFRECSLTGYSKAYDFINQMPKERIEENRTLVKFWCEPIKVDKDKIEKDAQL